MLTYLPYQPLLTFLCIWLCSQDVFAQRKTQQRDDTRSPQQELIYDNRTYLPAIQTVQVLVNGEEARFPILPLDQGDFLDISFDDLRADVRNYYYSVIHCDKDWTASRLTVLDFAKGYNEGRIDDFAPSVGASRAYTHYRFRFPDEYVAPKVPGNYLLMVYEDADKKRLVMSQRIYVVGDLVRVAAQALAPTITHLRSTHQKVNIELKTGLTVTNPDRDLHVVVMQNQRPDRKMETSRPTLVDGGTFRYDSPQTFNFDGGNEFRFFDMSALHSPLQHVQQITQDSTWHARLEVDEVRGHQSYAATFDADGAFFVRNADFADDPSVSADYANVTFQLRTPKDIASSIFVVGQFNHYAQCTANRMQYDAASSLWTCTIRLKQGIYDYTYATNIDEAQKLLSGDHFDTGNQYQVLVYHRRMGTYWDELLGFSEININR